MTPLILWELLAILLLIVVNGFFSGAEIAVLSANRGRLREWADDGDRAARVALTLAENPSRLLPTVQLGITLVGTLAAAFGGATIVAWLEGQLEQAPWWLLPGSRSQVALVIVVGAITVVSIVVGELVPKRLALSNAAAVARVVARPLDFLSRVARPAVWLLGLVTDAVAAIFGVRHFQPQGTSLQDIRHLIELGTAEGLVEPAEQRLAFEALALGDRTVRQIMKPRIDVDAVDVDTPQQQLLGVLAMAGFSRLPVYEGDLDHIIGFVHLKDVLRQHYLGWKLEVRKLIRPALVVPDTMRLDQLLVRFQEERNQLAIVVDEYGATRGMVTLEDLLEELVGELLTEHHERVEQLIVQRDASSWLVDGSVSIADLLKRIDRSQYLATAPRSVSSVAGLLLTELGRMPGVGESVAWHDLRLEVVDLDGQRIDRLLVSIPPPGKTQ